MSANTPLFAAMHDNDPASGVTLQRLTDDLDAGQVLRRSYGKTNGVSLALNENRAYWKAVAFVPRKLRALHRRGSLATLADASAAIRRAPGNLRMRQAVPMRYGVRGERVR